MLVPGESTYRDKLATNRAVIPIFQGDFQYGNVRGVVDVNGVAVQDSIQSWLAGTYMQADSQDLFIYLLYLSFILKNQITLLIGPLNSYHKCIWLSFLEKYS